MLRLIAIVLACIGTLIAHNVHEEWALLIGIGLVGFGLGISEMSGENRGRKH